MNDDFSFRSATEDDVAAIVELLADDRLGSGRESTDLAPYGAALREISDDPNNEMIVVEAAGRIVGCLQLTYIPGLSRGATKRAQIESVRVASAVRGAGLGQRLFEWAIKRSRARGCGLLQLTSDKQRSDAIRFYERLGFVASHEGMKLSL